MTVDNCETCLQHRPHPKHQRVLKLFPPEGPLVFIAIDILGPLPKEKSGNKFIIVIKDRYSKLTLEVPTSSVTAPAVASTQLDSWIIPYGIPSSLLSDNGSQLTRKLFAALCDFLGTDLRTTTAYHPQTNGQMERYNKTIIARLRHYVSEHKSDWDKFVQPLTYAYNSKVNRSVGMTTFSLVLSLYSPSPTLPNPKSLRTDSNRNILARTLKVPILDRIRAMSSKADASSSIARECHRKYFDQSVRHTPSYAVGGYIYLDKPDLRLAPSRRKSISAQKIATTNVTSLCLRSSDPSASYPLNRTRLKSTKILSTTR